MSSTFGCRSSNVIWLWSIGIILVKYSPIRCMLILLPLILWLLSSPFPNGVSISRSVNLLHWMSTTTSLWILTTSLGGMRLCLPLLNVNATITLFIFNHIIVEFDVPKGIVTNHRSNFWIKMMFEFATKLGLLHENSTLYYSQDNIIVEAINHLLKTMIQCMWWNQKHNWNLILSSALWDYQTSTNTSKIFTHFQLIYGVEVVFPIGCEIPSLKLVVGLIPFNSTME